jgi:hypothetical protein
VASSCEQSNIHPSQSQQGNDFKGGIVRQERKTEIGATQVDLHARQLF